jgi:hypothetical protein
MFAGLQNLISAHYFIGTTTFFKYKNYILILRENYVLLLKKKSQGMYLKKQRYQLKHIKCKKLNYPVNIFCTYV